MVEKGRRNMVPEVESVHEDPKERKMVLEGKPESKIQGRRA